MPYSEYRTHVEHRFDAFRKKFMRFDARSCYKEIRRKEGREISLDHLIEELDFTPQNSTHTSSK